MRRLPAISRRTEADGQAGTGLPVLFWRRLKRLALVALALASPVLAADDAVRLRELADMARNGAPQLVLARMNAEQPGFARDPVGWMRWERERLRIMRAWRMDEALAARLAGLPADIDDDFRHQAMTLLVDARLQQGRHQVALDRLRELIWQHGAHVDAAELARWRRLVIRAYLDAADIEGARLALQRYRQDYGHDDAEVRLLEVRVMLRGGRPAAALALLAQAERPVEQFLRALAQLQAGAVTPAEALTRALKGHKQVESPELKRAWWSLAARAAARIGQPDAHIRYLERALALPADPMLGGLFEDVSADTLWQAWLARGQEIGNAEQRLLGRDEDWYFPATEMLEKQPLRARIFFAVLAEHGSSPQRRELAHEYLMDLLADLPGGRRLVRTLYLEASRYADVSALPAVVRYRLIDQALEDGELRTAARLMSGLARPPRGQDAFGWNLRRARVAVYTGEVETGARLLRELLEDEKQEWNEQHADQLVQILFDLQTVKRHREALELFRVLMDKPLSAKRRREMLFWMAESLQALEQYDQAAWLYLRSATFTDPAAMDPWAQTARYRAARALVQAGYPGDARRIYRGLVRATRDAGRRAVLQGELQRLRLIDGDGAADAAGK